jgi:uncharacterized protein YuzE
MSNPIKVTYDRQSDAAYIYLKNNIGPGGVADTHVCEIDGLKGGINLDFDRNGQLVGIEILDAFALLPSDFFS